jgi:tetratricopeptide (TPR) repeat protein
MRGTVGATVVASLALACTTPLQLGERRYQQGDRQGALKVWSRIDSAATEYGPARERIDAVTDERHQLVVRYVQRGRYYEEKGRLAEGVLDYRLALRLDPSDHDLLEHVQELVRKLARARSEGLAEFEAAFARRDLAAARVYSARLHNLDPFSPEVSDGQRRLGAALSAQIDSRLDRGKRGFTYGNYGDAEEAFREVLELDPQNESARGYLAYIDRIRGEEAAAMAPAAGRAPAALPSPAESRRSPRPVATDDEIRAEGFLQNALVAEAGGDPFQAIRYDQAALRADPNHAGARSHLAGLRRALAPQIPELIEAGRRSYQREDLQAALDQWQRALLIDPDNADAQDHAARAEKLLERLEELRADSLPSDPTS